MEIIALIISSGTLVALVGQFIFFKSNKRSANAGATQKEIQNASDVVVIYRNLITDLERYICYIENCESRKK